MKRSIVQFVPDKTEGYMPTSLYMVENLFTSRLVYVLETVYSQLVRVTEGLFTGLYVRVRNAGFSDGNVQDLNHRGFEHLHC